MPRDWKGTVFAYRGVWQLEVKDPSKTSGYRRLNTGIPIDEPGGQEEAKKWLAKARTKEKSRESLQQEYQLRPGDALTLATYARKTWLPRRKKFSSWNDDASRLEEHLIPALGHLPLVDIKKRHLKQFLAMLETKKAKVQVAREKPTDPLRRVEGDKPLAGGTIRNVMALLSAILRDAEDEELIDAIPRLKPGSLPAKEDDDPTWRETAIFTASEVETLISDDRIPIDRRVCYGIAFLTGTRFGETAALRWWMLEPMPELDRLKILKSYSTRLKKEKSTKTKTPRKVPVHRALAALLAQWKLTGFSEIIGRKPLPEDLIVPSRLGANRSVNHMLKRFHEDCTRVGLRLRRQHDARRTFRSIAMDAGADPYFTDWITHGRKKDVASRYTEPRWETLCAVVKCIPVRMREPKILELRQEQAAAVDGAVPIQLLSAGKEP